MVGEVPPSPDAVTWANVGASQAGHDAQGRTQCQQSLESHAHRHYQAPRTACPRFRPFRGLVPLFPE
jgi:hypothetical protein